MKYAVLLAFFLSAQFAIAQYQRHYKDVLPKKPQFHQSGWFVSPGLTYTVNAFGKNKQTLMTQGDSSLIAESRGVGRLGWYIDGGWYHIIDRLKLIKMIDYGVAYKSVAGVEKFKDFYKISDAEIPLAEGRNQFRTHEVSLFGNAYAYKQIKQYDFILNGLGLNVDYAIIQRITNTHSIAGLQQQFPGRISAQLHYKFGYGIKLRGNWIFLPSVETPILNIWKFTSGMPGIHMFSSRYQPLLVSLKLMRIRPNNKTYCPPVESIPLQKPGEEPENNK